MPPRSIDPVPRKIRWLWSRCSSLKSARIHSARRGTSSSSSFSTAMQYTSSLREERVVVGPGRVRDRLPVRLLLHVLLDARVHVAELVVQADDGLAVERRDEPQHAVRRRVVRPEVEQHRVRVVGRAGSAPTGSARAPRRARGGACGDRGACWPSDLVRELDGLAADGIVLAVRMAVPALGQEDPLERGMARRTGCPSDPRPRAPGSRRTGTRGRCVGTASPSSAHTRRRRRRAGREPRSSSW